VSDLIREIIERHGEELIRRAPPIECSHCGQSIASVDWLEHARTVNPFAYREGWPCTCRPERYCAVHAGKIPGDVPTI
jgi:hypothetical protein